MVTGAAGYLGRLVVEALAARPAGAGRPEVLLAADVRAVPARERLPGVTYLSVDVRDPGLAALLREHGVDTVVHLAAVVTPPPGMTRDEMYAVDVLGTQNVLTACVETGVGKLVVTSSGAAYGYHADNPPALTEDAPLRGNEAFAYAHHKRLVEEMLATYRARCPELRQLVLRPGTILGAGVHNQITDLFEKPVVLGVAGEPAPFVFVWDRDVVDAVLLGVGGDAEGVYNLAGDGTLTTREIARLLGKTHVALPAQGLRAALALLHRAGLSQYGPEQVLFLEHRPVLDNRKLKEVLGFVPRKTSEEAFRAYLAGQPREAPARPLEAVRARLPWGRPPRPRAGFAGRVVVVTGGARGLGLAIGRRFGRDGARVALLDRDADAVARAADRLRGKGIDALGLACDVTDEAACRDAVEAVRAALGDVDVLVNNAGITHVSRFEETDPRVYERVMDVNFHGAVRVTHAALPQLLRTRGSIVVLSSIAGFAPLLDRSGYCASKHALHGLFDTLRAEMEPRGLHVLMVCPAFAATGIGDRALGGDGGRPAKARRQTGALLSADEVADAVHDATRERRREIVLSRTGRLARLATRVSPALYEKLMVWRVGAA